MGIGDITIDGNNFRINVETYKGKDIIDFAPRATVPGNSAMMSDLSLYQPLVQTDWQHGMGFHWYSDSAGYLSTVGNVDTRHDGLAMLFTERIEQNAGEALLIGMCTWNGSVYAWGEYGLNQYWVDPGTGIGYWTTVYGTGKVNFAINAGDYLLFCPDGARIQKYSTAGVLSDAGLDADAADYKWLIINAGFIYAGKDGSNRIHFDTNADLSQLEGTSADPDAIYCGISNLPTLGAVVYAGNLYVSRADGLWHIGEDKVARRALDFSDSISENNFRSMAVVNGYLIFPIRDRIIQWNGSRTADITPTRITDEYPYISYTRFKNFVSVDNFLLCIGRTNDDDYKESLLCFDGVGWHRLSDLTQLGIWTAHTPPEEVRMLSYDGQNNRLWYAHGGEVRYFPMQAGSFPYPNFPTTGQHSLISSRLDMGFRRITKSAASLFVEARNVTDTRYLTVWYSLDGGDWMEWDKITDNGITELRYPGGYQTVEFNYMLLRFDFVTDDIAQTPVLESYTLNFIMRPQTRMGYSFQVVAASNYEHDMYQDDRSAATILKQLREIRNSEAPVKFTGLLGDEIYGYLTSIGESMVYRTENDVEYVIQCSFVEVSSDANQA